MPRVLKPEQVVFFIYEAKVSGADGLRSRGFNPDAAVLVENEDRCLVISERGHGLCLGPEDWMFTG